MNCAWTADVGFGVAQRAPTATDLFADIPYLSILLEGPFFFPGGNTGLEKETAYQVDAGLTANYACFRTGLCGFHTWIQDFITYDRQATVNNDARMYEAESYAEYELSDCLSCFGTLSYVEGEFQDAFPISGVAAGDPIWGIAPLESRLGLRIKDGCRTCCGGLRWGAEYAVRMIDQQDHFNTSAGFGELATPGFTGVSLVGGVVNIGDRFYREHLNSVIDITAPGNNLVRGVVSRGRSFYVGIEAKY